MRCPRCNHQNPADNRFCGQCGNLLTADAAGLVRLPAESERRVVTILFADVSGFTAMSEQLDPEAVTTIVNECFTQLSDEIDKYGGIIDKYMGDAIMALFGAPTAHENDPERAIMAALGMQATLTRFSERLERRAGVKFRMRIGINTGPVVAGYVGSHIKSSYTALGDAVNLASRLQAAAPLGSVLVNETTYRLAKDNFDFVALEPLSVKGKSERVQAYEARRVKTQREERTARGIVSPFVGRDKELSSLRDAFEQARMGHAQLVSLVGEAGIGKSRLLYEFERSLEKPEGSQRPFGFLKGRSIPYGQLNTYWVIGEILRRYLSVDDSAPEDTVRRQLEAMVPAGRVPLIARFLAINYPDDRVARLTAEQLKREMHDALVAILRTEAAQYPIVLVFEDLHWVDPSSLALLHDLIARLSDQAVMFIALYRPEFSGFSNLPIAHTFLPLAPLMANESHALIEGLLAAADFPAPINEHIALKAGGNPFYVEEIIKSFMDAGLLVRDGNRWVSTRDVADVKLPDTLQGVIMERIDSLEETAKRVLQQSAVIGNVFQERVLESITDVERQIDDYLDRLEHQEFVFPQLGSSEREYIFKHLLSHEVAYNSLLIARRRMFHRRIGRYLEARYVERLDNYMDTLADHFYRGGEWLKAMDYAQRAGRRAMALFANAEALQYFSRMLEIADRLESGKTDLLEDEQPAPFDADQVKRYRLDAYMDRGDVRALISEYDAAIGDFQSVLALSTDARVSADLYWRLGDAYEKKGQLDLAVSTLETGLKQLGDEPRQVEAAKIYATLGWVHVRKGNYGLAEEVSNRGLALLNEKDNPIEYALVQKTLGVVDRRRGNFDEAILHYQLSLSLSQQVGHIREIGRLHNNLANVYAQRGNHAEALQQFQLTLETMQKIGDPYGTGMAYNNLGGLYNLIGDYPRALNYHRLSLETRSRIGDQAGVAQCHNNLSETYRLMGEPQRAIEHLQESLNIALAMGEKTFLAERYRQLAQTYQLAGDLARAQAHGTQSLINARAVGQKLEEAIAVRVLASIDEQLQRPTEAEAGYRQALELFVQLGADQELAITHEAYGQWLAAQARTAEALAHLRAAHELYAKLNAQKDEARVLESMATIK